MKILKILLLVTVGWLATMPLFAQTGAGLSDFLKGTEAFKAKKLDIALKAYQSAITKEPNEARYVYEMGVCQMAMNNDDEAIKSFEKTVKIKPDYVEAYKNLAKISVKKKDRERAAKFYRMASIYEKDPKTKVEGLKLAAKLFDLLLKYDSVRNIIREAKALANTDADIWHLEAINNNKLGVYDSVLVYTRYVTKNPTRFTYLNDQQTRVPVRPPRDLDRFFYEMGYAYYKQGKYDSARTVLKNADYGLFKDKVFALMPEYQLEMAIGYLDIYEKDKARDALAKAMEMNPKYKEAQDMITKIDAAAENKPRILKRIQVLIDSITRDTDMQVRSKRYCRLCQGQFEVGNFAEAATAADKCLEFDKENLAVTFIKSISLYKVNNINEAIFSMDKWSESPKLVGDVKARFFFILGMMYKASAASSEGDPAQGFLAKSCLRKATQSRKYKSAASQELIEVNASLGAFLTGDEGEDGDEGNTNE